MVIMCVAIPDDGDNAGLWNIAFQPFFDVGDDLRRFQSVCLLWNVTQRYLSHVEVMMWCVIDVCHMLNWRYIRYITCWRDDEVSD